VRVNLLQICDIHKKGSTCENKKGGANDAFIEKEKYTIIQRQGPAELGNCGGHLESLLQDPLLPLDPDLLGPLHEAGEVTTLGEDVVANREVLYTFLVQGERDSP
jgi:hypothetical protein